MAWIKICANKLAQAVSTGLDRRFPVCRTGGVTAREYSVENHEKLAHLSEKEIEEVVSMYQEGRLKISEILERFNIDVKPGKLLQILPPEKTEKVCEMCGEYMYRQLAARTSSFKNGNDYFCLKCGHKEFVDNKQENKVCNCEGCTTKRKMLYQSKRDRIKDVYGKEQEKI